MSLRASISLVFPLFSVSCISTGPSCHAHVPLASKSPPSSSLYPVSGPCSPSVDLRSSISHDTMMILHSGRYMDEAQVLAGWVAGWLAVVRTLQHNGSPGPDDGDLVYRESTTGSQVGVICMCQTEPASQEERFEIGTLEPCY